MKEIIISKPYGETIDFRDVNERKPIFAKQKGKLCGMVVKENSGWILKTGGDNGATGQHESLLACIESCIPYGYTFFVN